MIAHCCVFISVHNLFFLRACVCVCLLSIFRFSFMATRFSRSILFLPVLSFGTFIIFIAISYSIWPSVSCLPFGLCLFPTRVFPEFSPFCWLLFSRFGQNVSSPLLIFSVARMFAFALLAMAEMQCRLDEAVRASFDVPICFGRTILIWYLPYSVLFWPIRHDWPWFDLFYTLFVPAICLVNKF